MRRLLSLLLATLLAACSNGVEDGVDIGFIDREESMVASGVRLSAGAQHLRGATRSGLVALDSQGEVVPALADRWTVTDGGRIFVFRLREGTWPDGSELTAETVRSALTGALRELRGTSLGLDLTPVEDVRAMTGRVIEVRLTTPVPNLLLLLAQPELGLTLGQGDTGPMVAVREGGAIDLTLKPPTERGLPERDGWQDDVRPIRLIAMDAREAMRRFDDGEVQVVLGGRLGELPLVDIGPLSRGTIRLDPAIGLFGLHVRRGRGVLGSDDVREAIAMAINRNALLAPFNISGWTPSTRVIAPALPGDPGLIPERWVDTSIEDLRATAAARVARFVATRPDSAAQDTRLALAIDQSPGHDLLYRELAAQLATIGLTLERVNNRAEADLVLVDRVARYGAPRWFLNQFNCGLDNGLCSADVDFLVTAAMEEADAARRDYAMAEAEAALTLANVYIPFGPPIRWSLVRGTVGGYAPNRWAYHPLPDMAVIPR